VTAAGRSGTALLVTIALCAAAAPALSPHDPVRQFADYENAPPMPVRVLDPHGRPSRPFVYPLILVDRLERRFEEDRTRPMPIRWFSDGTIASIDAGAGPWLPLGADPLGRDVLARLLHGARLSLAVAAVASFAALVIGALIGGTAGLLGGRTDALLMATADFILILPALFIVLVMRAALPLVLTVPQVFWALTLVLAMVGWPIAARGVRAIVATERQKAYAEAAYALGATHTRILLRHLLPATAPFLFFTGTILVPAFVVTESTMSMVGLGFPVPSATWGTMLRDAWQGGAFADAPWLMAPAAALVLTVLAIHLVTSRGGFAQDRPGTFS
jgi:peptide/nickel transport system permease protein